MTAATDATAAMLRVERLSRAFFGVKAVDNVSLSVRAGSITGLIGPNGSGKSTVIDCITGVQRADSGRWFLGDVELTGRPSHNIAQAGLARTFQTVRVYEDISLANNVALASYAHRPVAWWRSIVGSRSALRADAHTDARVRALVADVGLAAYVDAPASVLSYGQRKLLALTATLIASPKLLLLDEPVAGVNPTMILQVERLIRRINEAGVTVLLVEHNVDFIMRLCERVIVLDAGQVLTEGPPSLVREDPRVLEAYMGGSVEDDLAEALHG